MNTCILMAEVITNPELRKTPDDVDVANMTVEFPGLRENDPSTRIRVVGWGNLGVEMSEKYATGDRVVLEGRLSMNVIELNGYKEKRAELVASHIYAIGSSGSEPSQPSAMASNVINLQQPTTPEPDLIPSTPEYSATPAAANNTEEEYDEGKLDEIPF